MPRKTLIVWLVLAALLLLAACSSASPEQLPDQSAPAQEVDPGSQPETPAAADTQASAPEIDAAGIYAARCASCHAADRSGNRGPALLPDRLDKGPAAYTEIITNGSGPMPAWGSRLSAEEISALVDYILSTP